MELDYYRESWFGLCSITVARVKTSLIKESTPKRKKNIFLLSSFFDYSKAAFQWKGKKTGVEVYPKTGDQKQVWLAVIHDKKLWTNEKTGKCKIITRLLIGQIEESKQF